MTNRSAPLRSTGRSRAQRLYQVLGVCEVCGITPAVERHHRDGDEMNNERRNVVFSCRRCHARLDQRIAIAQAAWSEQRRSATHCKAGHEYTPENTRIKTNGWRDCRLCARIRDRTRYANRT